MLINFIFIYAEAAENQPVALSVEHVSTAEEFNDLVKAQKWYATTVRDKFIIDNFKFYLTLKPGVSDFRSLMSLQYLSPSVPAKILEESFKYFDRVGLVVAIFELVSQVSYFGEVRFNRAMEVSTAPHNEFKYVDKLVQKVVSENLYKLFDFLLLPTPNQLYRISRCLRSVEQRYMILQLAVDRIRTADEFLDLLRRNSCKSRRECQMKARFIQNNLPAFFERSPTNEEINELIALLKGVGFFRRRQLHQMILMHSKRKGGPALANAKKLRIPFLGRRARLLRALPDPNFLLEVDEEDKTLDFPYLRFRAHSTKSFYQKLYFAGMDWLEDLHRSMKAISSRRDDVEFYIDIRIVASNSVEFSVERSEKEGLQKSFFSVEVSGDEFLEKTNGRLLGFLEISRHLEAFAQALKENALQKNDFEAFFGFSSLELKGDVQPASRDYEEISVAPLAYVYDDGGRFEELLQESESAEEFVDLIRDNPYVDSKYRKHVYAIDIAVVAQASRFFEFENSIQSYKDLFRILKLYKPQVLEMAIDHYLLNEGIAVAENARAEVFIELHNMLEKKVPFSPEETTVVLASLEANIEHFFNANPTTREINTLNMDATLGDFRYDVLQRAVDGGHVKEAKDFYDLVKNFVESAYYRQEESLRRNDFVVRNFEFYLGLKPTVAELISLSGLRFGEAIEDKAFEESFEYLNNVGAFARLLSSFGSIRYERREKMEELLADNIETLLSYPGEATAGQLDQVARFVKYDYTLKYRIKQLAIERTSDIEGMIKIFREECSLFEGCRHKAQHIADNLHRFFANGPELNEINDLIHQLNDAGPVTRRRVHQQILIYASEYRESGIAGVRKLSIPYVGRSLAVPAALTLPQGRQLLLSARAGNQRIHFTYLRFANDSTENFYNDLFNLSLEWVDDLHESMRKQSLENPKIIFKIAIEVVKKKVLKFTINKFKEDLEEGSFSVEVPGNDFLKYSGNNFGLIEASRHMQDFAQALRQKISESPDFENFFGFSSLQLSGDVKPGSAEFCEGELGE